jgi:hypothetical protein
MWSWYAELQFYPEYLHSIYRIRFFLIYYFNLHPLEQRAFFFSHFNLIKIFKNLQINIYYYDGQAESIYSEMLFEYAIALKYDIDMMILRLKFEKDIMNPIKF